ncbi:MAG: hypothetical protein AAFY98_02840 [Verrucomicrobiota bacterium]
MKELPALDRLLELDEIAAAFVYHEDGGLVGAAVPPHYGKDTLLILVNRIENVMKLIRQAKMGFRETRFVYEGHALWLKSVGGDSILVVFAMADTEFYLLRQPLNLAVVNLESTLSRQPEEEISSVDTELLSAAHRAELELMQSDVPFVEEPNFLKLVQVTQMYLGPIANQVLQYSLRELKISLPYQSAKDMQHSVEYAGNLIQNVERRKQYIDEVMDVIERIEVHLEPAPAAEVEES